MPHLIFFPHRFQPSGSHNRVIDYGNDFDLIFTFSFLFQELAFLHRVEAVLIRIGKQIIRFSMCQTNVIQYSLSITFHSISQTAFHTVF